MLANLGIIAGNGDLPKTIADIYKNIGGKCFVASITPNLALQDMSHENFDLGKVGAIIKYFRDNKVEEIILVGGIDRPDLKSLKVDIMGSFLLAKILKNKMLGDDNILKIVADFIESKNFKIISPKDILKLDQYNAPISSNTEASSQDQSDVNIGKDILTSMGALDVGQSVIVSNGYVVGIEAAEGTDNLIKRCGLLRNTKKGGVLVKISKTHQDMRLDTPVIGPDTIKLLAQNNYSGLAIEKTGVIIANPAEVKKLLDKNDLFLQMI